MVIDIYLYLVIYSFLGWCCETLYCSFGEGNFVNRGFLIGPFCPVYGFGAIFALWGLQWFNRSTLLVFSGGMLITSVLEYITSFAMEKLFHAKWWDYKDKRFNLNGRVCLLNSVLFGLLCIILEFDLHPFIGRIVRYFSYDFKLGFLLAFTIYLIVDLTLTVRSVMGIKKRISAIAIIKKELIEAYQSLNEKLNIDQLISELTDKKILDERIQKLNEKLRNNDLFERRIINAFPKLKLNRNNESLTAIRQTFKDKTIKK